MKAAALAAALLAVPPALAADSQWTLRQIAAYLRQSPAEVELASLSPAFVLQTRRQRWRPNEQDLMHEQSLRWHGGAEKAGLRLEWNLLGRAQSASDPGLLPSGGSLVLDGRSQALQGDLRQNGLLLTGEVDQLNLRWQGETASAILGRQAVNLGQQFYFSPMDFFAPFNPAEAYRDFRAGVDALRLSWGPSPFSLLEAVLVAGQRPAEAGSPWKDRWDLGGDSGSGGALFRAQANGEAWSWTLLSGRVREEALLGSAVQLELAGSSWGLEGLWAWRPRDLGPGARQERCQASLGHSRQWSASHSSRIEAALELVSDPSDPRAQDWQRQSIQAAMSLQAQAGPLWSLSATALAARRFAATGHLDGLEAQVSAERSLSDESALGWRLALPVAWDGQPAGAPSSLAPYRVQMELRTTL